MHIDLKPENVLVKIVGDAKQNVHYLIKLIDFGESYSPKIDALACKIVIINQSKLRSRIHNPIRSTITISQGSAI